MLPPNSIISAGAANSACTAGRIWHPLAAAFSISFVCLLHHLYVHTFMYVASMYWDILL